MFTKTIAVPTDVTRANYIQEVYLGRSVTRCARSLPGFGGLWYSVVVSPTVRRRRLVARRGQGPQDKESAFSSAVIVYYLERNTLFMRV